MIDVYVIGGMMGAGKTTFIKNLKQELKDFLFINHFSNDIEKSSFKEDCQINFLFSEAIKNNNYYSFVDKLASLEEKNIVIELDGTLSLAPLMAAIMQTKNLVLKAHAYVLDVKYINYFWQNYQLFFKQQLFLANAFILSNYHDSLSSKLTKVKKFLSKFNDEASIIYKDEIDSLSIKKISSNICDCLECLDLGQCNQECQRKCMFFKNDTLEKPFYVYYLTPTKNYDMASLKTCLESLPSTITRCKGLVKANKHYISFDYLWHNLKEYKSCVRAKTYFIIVSDVSINKDKILALFSKEKENV